MQGQEIRKKNLDSNICESNILRKFNELCSEETPMVRRAVATKIGEIA